MNSQTLAQIEKEKEETYGHLSATNTGGGGGGAANSFATGGSSGGSEEEEAWWEPGTGGSSSNSGGGGVVTPAPIPADEVPGYYDVLLGGSTRPTRMPTKRPTNKPSINAEQAMHRYSFCGKFWTDVSIVLQKLLLQLVDLFCTILLTFDFVIHEGKRQLSNKTTLRG